MKHMRASFQFALILLVLFWLPGTSADTIELADGTRLDTPKVEFKDDLVVLADGRTIPRNQVRRIIFTRAADAAGPALAAAATTDEGVQELLQQAQAARQEYPDVGAVTLIETGEWTLRPDGTQVERMHSATLILKEPWKSAGRIGMAYEDGRSRLILRRARTITADGRVYNFDPAELTEAKPSGDMVFFTKYKTLTGQLPEVEVGSIVETIWETEIYNPYDRKLFFPRWYFGGTEPALYSRVTVRVPRGQELYFQAKNFADDTGKAQESEEGDYHVYQWELRDIAHIIREPAMPPPGEVLPAMAASLFKDWDYIFDYLGQFQREHTQVTPEIETQVAEIIGAAATDEEKIARIYHWLQREIRYISIKGSMGSGWSGHPATLTLQNKYGDCIDKATLFATMLKAIDIQASPVVLATYGMAADDRTLPTMYGNHAITKVNLDGREFHLDCTGTSFRYPYFVMMDHGVTTINVLEREIGRIEVPPAAENALDINLRMRLDEEGNLKAIVKFNTNGSIEGFGRMGLEQINKMFRKMVVQQALNQLSPGAELKSIEVSDESDLNQPLEIKLKVLLPEYPTFAGELMIFKMPLSELASAFATVAALDERQFDVLSPSTIMFRQHTELELPEGYVPKGLPESVNFKTPYTSYEARYNFDGQTVVFDDSLSLNKRAIPAQDYQQLKKFLEDVTDFTKLPLFLYHAAGGAQ
ncbi:MAG: DUF3857 and transglutaminase domain-containing protein [Planctomycetota bacterium]